MKRVIVAYGGKENIYEDINTLAKKIHENPKNIVLVDENAKEEVIKRASSLFIEDNLVITILDPKESTLMEIKPHIEVLKESAYIILYFTDPEPSKKIDIEADIITLERDAHERIKMKVVELLKKYNKQMTHNAFEIFREKIRDESVIESELIKLINYVGPKKKIESKDVQAITSETHQDNLILLFDAFSKKDRKKVLQIIDNLINNMNTPIDTAITIILSFIIRQTRLLLHAKEIENNVTHHRKYGDFVEFFKRWKEGLNLSPSEKKHYLPYQNSYYAFKLINMSKQFKKEDLIALLNTLVKIDITLKKDSIQDKRLRLEHGLLEAI